MTPDRTRWCELLVGLEGVEVLDVVREGERLVLLHEPFRAALSHHLPDATAVADPFHVVAWAPAAWTPPAGGPRTRPWASEDAKGDSLYRCRKLLALAEERLDEAGSAKLRGLLAAGDPFGEVHEAWTAKEALRDLYSVYGQPELPGAGSTASSTTADRAAPRSCEAWPGPSSAGEARSWPGTPRERPTVPPRASTRSSRR